MGRSRHLRQVKRQLYKNLWKAYKGWYWWHRLVKKHHVENNMAVVLMPSCVRDDNFYALLYLDKMLESRKYKKALILTHDPVVEKCASLFSKNILAVQHFSRKKSEDLMQYYCLYEFDKRLIVASLDEPNGRNGSALIGKKGTTSEEIFVVGVYRVYPFTRPEMPMYTGDDADVKIFLRGEGI